MPVTPNQNAVDALRSQLIGKLAASLRFRDRQGYRAFARAAKDARVTGWGRIYASPPPVTPEKLREYSKQRQEAQRKIEHQIEMACIAQVIRYAREYRHWETSRAKQIDALLTSMGVNPSRSV